MGDVDTGQTDPERAVILAVARPGDRTEADLEELEELLRTAVCQSVSRVVQRRDQPDPRTYLGSGKLTEAEAAVTSHHAEVVVVDDELSPSQQRLLENRFGLRVVDRTALILDIFARHAHTAEGKLQVELAQLQYQLPRMRGMWKHLERLGGGVGTRGPGESQLETDRRLARDRITLLRRRLRDVERRRRLQRKERGRTATPAVALVGYTNAGKSSLLNALTGATVSSRNRLFETLDPTTRRYEHVGRTYTVTDTVGFIRKLPHDLVEAFASTLEEAIACDLLLHVVDASIPEEERRAQMTAVDDVLEEIEASDIPRLLVLNKIDLLDPVARRRLHNRFPEAIAISARTDEGIEDLEQAIAEHFAGRYLPVDLLVPYEDGAALAALYALGTPVRSREDTPEGVRVRAHLPRRELERYRRFAIALPEDMGSGEADAEGVA
jgi:GTP-binding protein HflX